VRVECYAGGRGEEKPRRVWCGDHWEDVIVVEGFRTQADAQLAVFDFIEGWYNPRRRHSALDYRSPMVYERAHGTDTRSVASGSTIAPGGAISISPSVRV
jgi:hypothetical protein